MRDLRQNAAMPTPPDNADTLKFLRDQLRSFAAERAWQQYHSPKNLAMALSVETAELVEVFQWMTEEESRHPGTDSTKAAADEIADVLLYLIQLADKLDIDIAQAAVSKLQRNALKYPVPGK